MKSILELLYENAETNPNRKIYNFLDCDTDPLKAETITNELLISKSRDMAWALKEKGAKKGDRAIILCMQDAGTIFAILGCMMEIGRAHV